MIHYAKKSMGLKKFSRENFSPETSFIRSKKSLGQNFLKSEPALRAMCEEGNVNKNDVIIEIGPGKGALTNKLLERAKKVIAIEKDHDLIKILEDKFRSDIKNRKLELINADILEFDPSYHELREGEYKIVSNIPYNITGAIFKKFLAETIKPSAMVLLVQKEVAMRIVATNKKESILSLSIKAYGTPRYIMKVGKRFFSPSPKVDSAIVAIIDISNSNFRTQKEEEKFFKIIKTGFAHKRKVLRKNLEVISTADIINKLFEELKIDPKTRSEDLALPIWLAISRYLSDSI